MFDVLLLLLFCVTERLSLSRLWHQESQEVSSSCESVHVSLLMWVEKPSFVLFSSSFLIKNSLRSRNLNLFSLKYASSCVSWILKYPRRSVKVSISWYFETEQVQLFAQINLNVSMLRRRAWNTLHGLCVWWRIFHETDFLQRKYRYIPSFSSEKKKKSSWMTSDMRVWGVFLKYHEKDGKNESVSPFEVNDPVILLELCLEAWSCKKFLMLISWLPPRRRSPMIVISVHVVILGQDKTSTLKRQPLMKIPSLHIIILRYSWGADEGRFISCSILFLMTREEPGFAFHGKVYGIWLLPLWTWFLICFKMKFKWSFLG